MKIWIGTHFFSNWFKTFNAIIIHFSYETPKEIFDKLCKFKFENADECKNYFLECLQKKIDCVPLAEISNRSLHFLPETIQKRVNYKISDETQKRERNQLINELQKLSLREIIHQNNNYGDDMIYKLYGLYQKFEKNDKFLQLIIDHLKGEVKFVFEEYIKKNATTQKQDYRFLLKNIELLIYIEAKFNSFLNSKLDLRAYKDSCLRILHDKFNEVHIIDR